MARRVERTTGLPRPRPKERRDSARTFAGITWTDRRRDLTILGVAVAFAVLVGGMLLFQFYDNTVLQPRSTVLRVGDEKVSLSYYTDRLLPFIQQNQQSNTSTALLEESLLAKLEEEALVILVGRDNGINLTDEEVTAAIAAEFGVPAGGSGSQFDSLYRDRLKSTGMSDGNYRRMVEASEVNKRLLDKMRTDLGPSGEQVTMRVVLQNSQASAQKILERAKAGEDFGTLAQTESLDLTTRQEDGLLPRESPLLLPESVKAAIEGKNPGDIVGPVQVEANWWVVRLEKRETAEYSVAQTDQLSQVKLDQALAAKRTQVKIDRSLDSGDLKWAEKHAG